MKNLVKFELVGLDGIDPNYAKNMKVHFDLIIHTANGFLEYLRYPQIEVFHFDAINIAAEYALKVEIGQVELQSDKHWDMFKQYLCKLIKQSVTHKKIKKAILEVVNHKDFKPDSWNSWNS